MKIKIVNVSNNALPQYATSGAAGLDLRAFLGDSAAITLKPCERRLINTGIRIEMPFGIEAQVRPRSGLALKHGITVLNTPGTIDSDFRGEISVLIINLGQEVFRIQDGDRIAQLVFARYERVHFECVQALDSSARGDQGYGHTGLK